MRIGWERNHRATSFLVIEACLWFLSKEIRSLKLCQCCKIVIPFSTQYSLTIIILPNNNNIIEKVVNWSKNGFGSV